MWRRQSEAVAAAEAAAAAQAAAGLDASRRARLGEDAAALKKYVTSPDLKKASREAGAKGAQKVTYAAEKGGQFYQK